MISRTDMISAAEQTPGRMLGPSAYSEALLPSLRLARSSRFARRIGKTLLVLLVIGFGFVSVAPWQQSVTGAGNVIAFAPGERQQTIEVPIKGRIVRWGENVVENAHLKKGDLIAEVQDVDPNLLSRLQDQLRQSESLVAASKVLLEAKGSSQAAASKVVISQEALLRTYQSAKEQIVASAEAAIAGAKNKVDAEERQLQEVEAALTQIKADFERQEQLFNEKIVAEVKFQMAQRKLLEAEAKVAKAEAYVDSAKNDLEVKIQDRGAKEQKALGDIDYAQSLLDKAIGDVEKAKSDVAKADTEISKAEKDLSEMRTKVSRQESQMIVAPFDGFLTSISANQGGQMVKEGDTLCVIVPDTADRAVQIWLDGNDAPLVEVGRHVRLQFEGWPAVQFAGWPSVAVGTFGGSVVSIDATDNGKGKFRVLVRPDDDVQEWPDERYLRQGVRANSWVLLEQVPLWYEIWRNMNGFPPVVTQPDDDKSKSKPPKLPK
jgi:multidrug resistance efflux pump